MIAAFPELRGVAREAVGAAGVPWLIRMCGVHFRFQLRVRTKLENAARDFRTRQRMNLAARTLLARRLVQRLERSLLGRLACGERDDFKDEAELVFGN